jgi:hypothetical protein
VAGEAEVVAPVAIHGGLAQAVNQGMGHFDHFGIQIENGSFDGPYEVSAAGNAWEPAAFVRAASKETADSNRKEAVAEAVSARALRDREWDSTSPEEDPCHELKDTLLVAPVAVSHRPQSH